MLDGIDFQKLNFSQIIEYLELAKRYVNTNKHKDAFRAEGFDHDFRVSMLNFLENISNLSATDIISHIREINKNIKKKNTSLSACYASFLKQVLLHSKPLERELSEGAQHAREIKKAHKAFIKNINHLIDDNVKVVTLQADSSQGSFSRSQKATTFSRIPSEKIVEEYFTFMNALLVHQLHDFVYITHEFICKLSQSFKNVDCEEYADGLILESVMIGWLNLENQFKAVKKKFPEGDNAQQHYFMQYMCSCIINHPIFTKSIGFRKDTYKKDIADLYQKFRYSKDVRLQSRPHVPYFDMSRLSLGESSSSPHSSRAPNTPRGNHSSIMPRQALNQENRIPTGLTPRIKAETPRASREESPHQVRRRSKSSPR